MDHKFPFSLSEEPIKRFDDRYCHEVLTRNPISYLDALDADLCAITNGTLTTELPPKLLFNDPFPLTGAERLGDFRVMPCVVRGEGRVTKTIKIVGSNFHRHKVPDRITVGRALLLDPIENFVCADFAAFALSSARTGACAALAMRRFAKARTLSVYGAGPVGWYAAYFAAADGLVDSIRVIDPLIARAERTMQSISTLFPSIKTSFDATADLETSATTILATDSSKAFFRRATTHSSLIISLGADSDFQAELDPAWAQSSHIVVDLADSALIGDLRRWSEHGLVDTASISTLLQSVKPYSDDIPLLFVSTGSALFDNLTVNYLLHTNVAHQSQ